MGRNFRRKNTVPFFTIFGKPEKTNSPMRQMILYYLFISHRKSPWVISYQCVVTIQKETSSAILTQDAICFLGFC